MTRAAEHLKSSDPVLANLIERVGPYRLKKGTDEPFSAIARSILYQQLAGAAATTIHGRFLNLYGGKSPSPKQILATSDEKLRGVGISRQKIGYLKDLAAKAKGIAFDDFPRFTDEEIVSELTQVKGVGVWTSQMFLIFRLGRPDVLPETDYGIQKAIQNAYCLRSLPLPKRVRKIGSPWQPYRSVASWYLWQSLDNGF